MCKHCPATARLARRAERVSKLRPTAHQNDLTPELFDKVISELATTEDQTAVDAALISFNTGMRIREIAALRWSDIDFEKKAIHVKGVKSSPRALPMTDGVAGILRDRRTNNPGAGTVFTEGHRLLSCKVNNAVKVACEKADVPVMPARMLRHGFVLKASN